MPLHFLTGCELSPQQLSDLLSRAAELKRHPFSSQALAQRSVALIFQKPSTRTRLSFQVGVSELHGNSVVLRSDEMQLSRGESMRDTALVLSRHVAAAGFRTSSDQSLQELALHAHIPIFNMLSPSHHPCQALADLFTIQEVYRSLAGLKVAYVGDGTNVARSLALLGSLAGMHVAVASPPQHALEASLSPPPQATGTITLVNDPHDAVDQAHAVCTDVWVSMGDEQGGEDLAKRIASLAPYRLDDALLDRARPHAFALHCLPAHPGQEITAEVLYGTRQRIWDQAENRRHVQKALLELLLRESGEGKASAGALASRVAPSQASSSALLRS
jgi:ornithine carbamoyltransferase